MLIIIENFRHFLRHVLIVLVVFVVSGCRPYAPPTNQPTYVNVDVVVLSSGKFSILFFIRKLYENGGKTRCRGTVKTQTNEMEIFMKTFQLAHSGRNTKLNANYLKRGAGWKKYLRKQKLSTIVAARRGVRDSQIIVIKYKENEEDEDEDSSLFYTLWGKL